MQSTVWSIALSALISISSIHAIEAVPAENPTGGTANGFNPFRPPFPDRPQETQRVPASEGESFKEAADSIGPVEELQRQRLKRSKKKKEKRPGPPPGKRPKKFGQIPHPPIDFPPGKNPEKFDPSLLPDPPFGEGQQSNNDFDNNNKNDQGEEEGESFPPDNGPDGGLPEGSDPGTPVADRATFDISSGVTPSYDGYKPEQVQLAGLNFLLNSLSSHPKLVKVNGKSLINGEVTITGFGRGANRAALNEIFNLGAIDQMLRDEEIKNPYQCPGDERYKFRMDWLMSTLMGPDVYKKMLSLPNDWETLGGQLGVETKNPDEATDNPNKIWVENSMISSSRHGRILEFQEQRGKVNRVLLRSTDFPRSPKPGKEAEFSDPTLHPNDYEGAAGEFIFNLPNGLMAYALAGKKGNQQPEAPASIVVNDSTIVGGDFVSNHNGSEISAPRDCMRCHRSGPIGQNYVGNDWNIGEELAPRLAQRLISERTVREAEERYTTGEKYNTRMKQVANDFVNKLKKANAFIGDEFGDMVPLIPDFEATYRQPLDFKQVAHELDLSPRDLKAALNQGDNKSLRERLGVSIADDILQTQDFKIDRHIFEKIYCELRDGLVGEPPLENEPVDDGEPLLNEPVHSSGGFTTR